MNLYEVVFAETLDQRDDDADTIFLVRAADFRTAIEEVIINKKLSLPHNGAGRAMPWIVYEIGIDSSNNDDKEPRVLRGPYCQCAYNYGWKTWEELIVGANGLDGWGEKPQPERT